RNTAELYSRLYQSGDYAHLQEVSQLLINLCVYSDTNRQRLANLRCLITLRDPDMGNYLADDEQFHITYARLRYNGKNIITGTVGKDNLYGNEESDILWGGRGDDALWGGKGDDTYIFNIGDGRDAIYDFCGDMGYVYHPRGASEEQLLEWAVQSGKDQIVFGEGI
ncbi:hypothetical protein V2E67_005101, partial [Citrobacter freundii]|nr:hypothetical protein [Citrobacter freundii]